MIDANGANNRQITTTAASDPAPSGDFDPDWSPDGSRIVFCREDLGNGSSSLYVMQRDGSQQRRLALAVSYGSLPTWSPDGSWISFVATTSSASNPTRYDLYKAHPDGTGLVRLTSDGTSSSPAWSPDGMQLMFTRVGTSTSDIWTMAADGTNQRAVTSDGESSGPAWR
jgi:TolB protein